MPSTLVYLDALPSRIALIAASLMLSGVSKSGSPAPRPITFRPAALRARALSVTAMVADGLTRLSVSERKAIHLLRLLAHLYPAWPLAAIRRRRASKLPSAPTRQRHRSRRLALI